MRELANKAKIIEFMRLLARNSREEVRVYFTGGTTAVLTGWRDSTIDVDLKFEPETDELFRALPEIKERLQINIELASPPDFIPLLNGWEDRCQFIAREGKVTFFNYDPYSQALSKIERGHVQDERDVRAMLENGMVDREKLLALFKEIEPNLYKYPAIDAASFSLAVESITATEK